MRKFGKESTAPVEKGVSREKSDNGWLKNHWCALSLCVIVLAAFLLRTVFAYGVSADGSFALSGGASAQYHLHIIESILDGSYSFSDATVNYPVGGLNVYPPLMDYLVAVFAMILSAVGFTTTEAASAALAGFNPVIGALTCIPVFLVGKELFGKKIGVVSALIFAFLALPISTSVFSSGTEYALAAFLISFMSLFLVKMAKALDSESETRKPAYVNAVLAGLFLGLAALTWNGFRILLTLVIVAMILQILADRFKGKDFTAPLVSYSVVMLLGVVLAAPYYMAAGLWDAVFSGPLLITVVAVLFGFLFKVLQSKPWVLTIPALVVVFAVFLAALYFAAPDLFTAFVSGNSIYSNSILESLISNRVSMSNVAAYYGWLTIWLPICLAIYETYVFFKRDRSSLQLFKVVWLFVMFFAVWTSYQNAAVIGVVFAVGSAAVIVKVIEKADLKSWVTSMKVAGFPGLFRKMIKPLPFVSVLVVALLVVVPNFAFAVDAGMSNNTDSDHFFSGNTQFVIKTGDSYPMGELWDEYDDKDKSGALVSWIDYTYDAVAQGNFTTVTDTVGGGVSDMAQIMLSDGTAGSVAAMALRIVMSGNLDDFGSAIPAEVKEFIADPEKAKAAILENPDDYGMLNSDITDDNAVYAACLKYVEDNMSEPDITAMYEKVCKISGKEISYVLVDGTMLPLQYGDNSNFSTLAYLADYALDGYGAAKEFFTYNTYYGTTQYTDAIYDTFIWKAMIGPSAADAGFPNSFNYLVALSASDGKEGSAVAIPGYGLTGYEVAFWNVQYNADNQAKVGDDGWEYMNGYDAVAKQKADGGVINYLSSIVMMEYVGVDAAYKDVKIQDENGKAVSGAEVTVLTYNDVAGKYIPFSTAKSLKGTASVAVPADEGYLVQVSMGGNVLSSYDSMPATVTVEAATLSGNIFVGDSVLEQDYFKLELDGKAAGEVAQDNIKIVDGKITVTGILPDTYTYTLYNHDAKPVSSGTVNVLPGDNDGFAVKVKSYKINATVNDYYGEPVDSGIIFAVNSATGMEFSAEVEDGKATINVLPGNYTVALGEGKVSMSTTSLNATSGDRSVTVTAYEAKTIDIIGGNGATFLVSAGKFSTISYENGTKVDIPFGMATDSQLYTVYGVSGDKVYTAAYKGGDSVTVTESAATTVTGVLKNGEKDALGTIRFTNADDATFVASAGNDGKFSIVIPAGKYTVTADNGNDKVYVAKKDVKGDMGDISLVDGRKITYSLRYDPQLTSTSYVKMTFALGLIDYTYKGEKYTMYSMADTDGAVSFYIPDDVESTIAFNNIDGNLDNQYFSCKEMKKKIDAGQTNNSNTVTIKAKSSDTDKWTVKECKVSSEYMDPKYKMTMTLIGNGDVSYDFSKDKPETMQPGEYDVVIDGTSGWYYKGTAIIYAGSTEIVGIEPKEVFAVEITKASADVLDIDSDKGKYYADGTTYYFVKGHEYFLKSVNNTVEGKESIQKVKYGYIDATADAVAEKIDMTATAKKMTVTGYLGVAASGTMTVSYDKTVAEFEVKSGAYTIVLPETVTAATFAVDVSVTVDGDEYYFADSMKVSGLKDGEVRNLAVVSVAAPEEEEDEDEELPDFEAAIESANFKDGKAQVAVKITNNTESKMTFILGAQKWAVESAATITIDGKQSATVTMDGFYNKDKVSVGTKGLAVTVTDLNNSDTKVLKITENTADQTGALGEDILVVKDGGDAFKDKVSAYEYMYAITFVNKDSYSKTASVSIDSVKDGWTVTIMDEDGKYVYESGHDFTVYGYQTTVLYVKVMPLNGLGEDVVIPSVSGTAKIGSTSETLKLTAEKVDLSTDSMSADGKGIYNEEAGVPSGIWFLVALTVLLIIATIWLASKRGVFSRKN